MRIMANGFCNKIFQRSYSRIVFSLTLILLCISLLFNLSYKFNTIAVSIGPDLCDRWKERLFVERSWNTNVTKQWWEWACLLEKEWDKGQEYTCKDMRTVGNYHVCFDEPFTPKPPCLVYSFGIDNDFRFDDAIADVGCDVYSFDPSMGVEDHQRSERVHFLNMGLATLDSDNFFPLMDGYTSNSKQRWKIRTLNSIRKMLGHEKRPIDVLKIDIESYEWVVVQKMINDGLLHWVKQLTLEWHIFPNEPMRTDFHDMYDTYLRLKKVGFRQFYKLSWRRVHNTEYFNSQNDNSLVNVLFFKKEKAMESGQ